MSWYNINFNLEPSDQNFDIDLSLAGKNMYDALSILSHCVEITSDINDGLDFNQHLDLVRDGPYGDSPKNMRLQDFEICKSIHPMDRYLFVSLTQRYKDLYHSIDVYWHVEICP